jgi:hypothetical protein
MKYPPLPTFNYGWDTLERFHDTPSTRGHAANCYREYKRTLTERWKHARHRALNLLGTFNFPSICLSTWTYVLIGIAIPALVLFMARAAFTPLFTPYSEVSEMLQRTGSTRQITLPSWPALPIPDSQRFLGLTDSGRAGSDRATEETTSITPTDVLTPRMNDARSRRATRKKRPASDPRPTTGTQISSSTLHDGIGRMDVYNRTDTDGVLTISRAGVRNSLRLVVYLRSGDRLALDGFGTGRYAVTVSFGSEWSASQTGFRRLDFCVAHLHI